MTTYVDTEVDRTSTSEGKRIQTPVPLMAAYDRPVPLLRGTQLAVQASVRQQAQRSR
jgi:hypothetical protein